MSDCRFCIIEGPETVQDFAKMELQEIQDNIRSRRNKIFLHMEEVSYRFHLSMLPGRLFEKINIDNILICKFIFVDQVSFICSLGFS